jgi:hypothetical protein
MENITYNISKPIPIPPKNQHVRIPDTSTIRCNSMSKSYENHLTANLFDPNKSSPLNSWDSRLSGRLGCL